MNKKYFVAALAVGVFMFGSFVNQSQAQTTDTAALQSTINQLNLQIQELQQKLAQLSASAPAFICGDVNNDTKVDIVDVTALVNNVFKNTALANPQAGDVNADGIRNLVDIITLVNYVFKGQPLNCIQQNQPPMINQFSGPSTVTVGTQNTWTLRATDSEDPTLFYSVQWGDNSSSSYIASSGISVFALHTYLQTGFRLLQLSVGDGRGGRSFSSTTVSVVSSSPNLPPVVNIYGSSTVPVGANYPWYFRAADPEGDNLLWRLDWGDFSSSTGTMASGQTLTKFHTYNQPKTFNIWFEARDPQGGIGSSTFQVSVVSSSYPINQPPSATIFGSSTVSAGFSGLWSFRGTDPEGTNLFYSLDWGDGTPNAGGTMKSGQTISYFHTYTKSGSSTIIFKVSDPWDAEGIASFPVLVVSPLNQTPYFIWPFNGPTSTVSGANTTWYATAVDPEGGLLNYWINWGDGSPNTTRVASSGIMMSFVHTYYASGSSTATYYPLMRVSDNGGNSVQSGPLTVRVYPAASVTPLPFQLKTLPLDSQQLNSIQSLQAELANIQAQLQALLLLLGQY